MPLEPQHEFFFFFEHYKVTLLRIHLLRKLTAAINHIKLGNVGYSRERECLRPGVVREREE